MRGAVWASAALAVALAASASAARGDGHFKGWDGSYAPSVAGGSRVEIPSFLLDGPIHGLVAGNIDNGSVYDGVEGLSLVVQQYRARTPTRRPYAFLKKTSAGMLAEVTYALDRDSLGVVSGYEDAGRTTAYYAACKPSSGEMHCLAMFWQAADQSAVAPMIEKMMTSFKK